MASKIALITGATGLLGREVFTAFEKAGWTVTGTGFSRASGDILKVDLTSEDEINAALQRVKVDSNPDGSRALNVTATEAFTKACSARNIFLLYISTDYVFSGKEGQAPYPATAETGPTNLYGELKLAGEEVVVNETAHSRNGAILRVPVLYGPVSDQLGNKESAVNVLMDQLWMAQEKGKIVKMDDWSIRYPTLTSDVGRVCKDVCLKYISTEKQEERLAMPQKLQFTAEERFTKYEICQVFAEILGLPLAGLMAHKQGNDPNAAVQRPYDCHLSTGELQSLGIDVSCQDFRTWWRWRLGAFKK
ncbi:MAG: hypothetical protein Q9162_000338 [Coniocarpon cinnabarinum]